MASRNTKTGLLTLLGIAAGSAIAWWRYNTASPAEKARIKNTINQAGNKIKTAYNDVEEAIVENYDKATDSVEEGYNKAKSATERKVQDIKS